jgi:hypothetical protein
MTWLSILRARLRAFLRHDAVIDDIEQEMRMSNWRPRPTSGAA